MVTVPANIVLRAGGMTPTFLDNFDGFVPANWYYNSFDEGGSSFWTNDAALVPLVYQYNGGKLHMALQKTPAGSPVTQKPYISGIMNTDNGHFTQQYGYWEVVVAVDKAIGFIYECIDLSSLHFPPDFYVRIWTDANNVQQLIIICASNIFFTNDSSRGFDPSTSHAYGIEWTATKINFYVDRVQVLTADNPGGGFTNGDPVYSKMHVNANFNGAPVLADPSALPVFAHVDSFTVWASKPF